MPYVKNELREIVDKHIDMLATSIDVANIQRKDRNGLSNYVITRILLCILKPKEGWSYDALSDVIKTLECAKEEIYRRIIAPYEDKAINKNGDLNEFSV